MKKQNNEAHIITTESSESSERLILHAKLYIWYMKKQKNEAHITTTESSESSERLFLHAKIVHLIHEKTKKRGSYLSGLFIVA